MITLCHSQHINIVYCRVASKQVAGGPIPIDVGVFDPFDRTLGKPVDEADAAFYKWKKCVQCARQGQAKTVPSYIYDKTTDSCGKFSITFIKHFRSTRFTEHPSFRRIS